MLKKFMMVPLLLVLAACGNGSNDGKTTGSDSAAGTSGTSMGEASECKKGPFNNKHELADLLVAKVYGKSQQNALDVLGRPDSVSDGKNNQLWHYHYFCSQPDEITKKDIYLGFVLKINQDGMVDVKEAPLSDIDTINVPKL